MLMEFKDTRNKLTNPLLEISEDISERPVHQLPYFEKLGLISAFIISSVILLISSYSFYIDFWIKQNYNYVLIDAFIMLLSSGAVYYSINAYKKHIVTEVLIDTAFQDGVFSRLQPLIENIAQSHIDTSVLLERLSNIDIKVQNIQKDNYTRDIGSKGFMEEPIAVGTSVKFIIKAIFLITLTMAFFMFLLNFNLGGITGYGVLLIYLMWWFFITNEYKLWKETQAWSMVFLPVLFIPVTTMLLGNLLNYNVLMAILYLFVGIYTIVYYLWAIYVTTGSLPFIPERKEEPVESEFFALQKKGMLREYLDIAISRLEKRMEKEIKMEESEYAWKK